MSNKDKRSGGGAFTFLLALAAFIMSGVSLFQQNADPETVEALKTKVDELSKQVVASSKKVAGKISEKMSSEVTLDSVAADLREVREEIAKGEESSDIAGDLSKAADNLDAYLAKSDLSAADKARARDLQASLKKLSDADSVAAEELDSLIDDMDSLASEAAEAMKSAADKAAKTAKDAAKEMMGDGE